jgi:hypothetical protein
LAHARQQQPDERHQHAERLRARCAATTSVLDAVKDEMRVEQVLAPLGVGDRFAFRFEILTKRQIERRGRLHEVRARRQPPGDVQEHHASHRARCLREPVLSGSTACCIVSGTKIRRLADDDAGEGGGARR